MSTELHEMIEEDEEIEHNNKVTITSSMMEQLSSDIVEFDAKTGDFRTIKKDGQRVN